MMRASRQCDCCDHFSISQGSDFEICLLCGWEQDIFGITEPDRPSSANHGMSIRLARLHLQQPDKMASINYRRKISALKEQDYPYSARQLKGRAVSINCAGILDELAFWEAYLEICKPEGAQYFGRNLDAFNDALNGGPGYPGDGVVLYFINTSSLRSFDSWQFYEGLSHIAENSASTVIFLEQVKQEGFYTPLHQS